MILAQQGAAVRSIDIVNELNYSKPSISVAMRNLRADGYITIAADGAISLTQSGREIAESMYERHVLISDWLISLGVQRVTAMSDACKMEHAMSEQSFNAIRRYINGVKKEE